MLTRRPTPGCGQSERRVDDAKRHRAGLRVGMSVTEGAAIFLFNRRMKKSPPMRSPPRGADLALQPRCAVHKRMLGSGFGRGLEPFADARGVLAEAAWTPR